MPRSGCCIDFYANPYVPQLNQSWNWQPERTSQELFDWFKAAKEERDREIQVVLDSSKSQSLKSQGRYMYDGEGNYLGYQTADGEMNYTISDPRGETCIEIPPLVKESHFEPLCEEDEDHTHEPKTIMVIEVRPPVKQGIYYEDYRDLNQWMSEEEEEVEEVEFEEELPSDVELSCVERETLMDETVLHPIQQVFNSSHWGPMQWNIDKPTTEIKQAPNEEENEVAKEFDGWPMERLEDGSLPQLLTQEKAHRSLDQHSLRVQRWYKRKHNGTLKCRDNRHPHYISRIRFGPGKFKFWWSDPFTCLQIFCSFIICF
ncbi:hypothetical protein Hanom_Chr14g01248221 [Helianthus anomalus]